jgi:hypothetical protein
MNPDLESEHAIMICKIFTLDQAHNLHLGKRSTVVFCALNCKARPDRFQLAGAPWKKWGPTIFFSQRVSTILASP